MGKLCFDLLMFLVCLQIYLIIIFSNYPQVSLDNFINMLLYNLQLHCPQSAWEELPLLNRIPL